MASSLDGAGALPATSTPQPLKRALDVAIAGAALLLLALPLALVALLIKLDNPGPALFRQPRHGLGGRVFEVFKFRSMVHRPTAAFEQASRGDKRVTRLGTWLRRTSIDELPQLLNVLRGEMSLVGPRPHPLPLDHRFSAEIPELMSRYRVPPGITGWAQINGARGETRDLQAMQTRIDYDLEYIARRGLLLDLRILIASALGGWTDPNAY